MVPGVSNYVQKVCADLTDVTLAGNSIPIDIANKAIRAIFET